LKGVLRTLWLVVPVAAGCAGSASVTRMVAGHRVEGRFVADEAYAAYLKGVVLETQGQVDAAMAAYGEAIEHDPDSAELWTRLGALRCADAAKSAASSKRGPWDAFMRASEIDPTYEETWTERARCHLKRGELDLAERAARGAVSLDPDRPEPAILLALVLERQGHVDEARRWLDGLVAREPRSIVAHEAMVSFAARTQDDVRRQASEDALTQLRPRADGKAPHRDSASLSEVDKALERGDFDRARRLALAARISSGALALRAAALGSVSFAPADGDARVAATVAADLQRDDAALERTVASIPRIATPLSPLATLLMAELLSRRIGAEAHRAFLQAAGPLPKSDDPLLAVVAARR
jgi:Tfp pilus assembly protein PilF